MSVEGLFDGAPIREAKDLVFEEVPEVRLVETPPPKLRTPGRGPVLPMPSTVGRLSEAQDREVWNKLKRQLWGSQHLLRALAESYIYSMAFKSCLVVRLLLLGGRTWKTRWGTSPGNRCPEAFFLWSVGWMSEAETGELTAIPAKGSWGYGYE